MLTQEGQEAARECLMRSGFPDTSENTANSEGPSDLNLVNVDSAEEETMSPVDLRRKKSTDIPLEYIEKVYFQLAFILTSLQTLLVEPRPRTNQHLWRIKLLSLLSIFLFIFHSVHCLSKPDFSLGLQVIYYLPIYTFPLI